MTSTTCSVVGARGEAMGAEGRRRPARRLVDGKLIVVLDAMRGAY